MSQPNNPEGGEGQSGVFTEGGEAPPQSSQPQGGEGGGAPTQGGEGGGTPPPAAPASLTPEQIAEAINKSALGKRLNEPAPAQDPFANMSPEQRQAKFDEAFNVWNPSEDVVKRILAGGQDALGAVAMMRDGISKQAVTMASYLVAQLKEELSAQLNPIQTHYQEQQVAKLYDKFYEANADLKPYDTIVRAVVDQMKAGGAKFSSPEEAFKELASRVKATMKQIPGLDGAAAPAGGGKGPNGQPGKMPPLSSGGQGGTGRGSAGGEKSKSPGMSIFG